MARDVYHIHVKEALLKDGWMITHDPLILMPDEDGVAVDLGAENLSPQKRVIEKLLLK